MSVNYGEASIRHLRDAELLYTRGRLPNADQLYGLSAECSVKQVLLSAGGLTLAGDMPAHRAHRVHADEAWPIAVAYLSAHQGGRLLDMLGDGAAFQNWSVNQRYVGESAVPARPEVDARRTAAWAAARTVDALRILGLYP